MVNQSLEGFFISKYVSDPVRGLFETAFFRGPACSDPVQGLPDVVDEVIGILKACA